MYTLNTIVTNEEKKTHGINEENLVRNKHTNNTNYYYEKSLTSSITSIKTIF